MLRQAAVVWATAALCVHSQLSLHGSPLQLLNATIRLTPSAGAHARAATYAAVLQSEVCRRLAWAAPPSPALWERRGAVAMVPNTTLDTCWPIALGSDPSSATEILLAVDATAAPGADGYSVVALANGSVAVTGADERGLLFGVGRLLRLANISVSTSFFAPPMRSVLLAGNTNVVSAPAYAIRGHQVGYRPKTNAYDAWAPAQMQQYFVDLALFGTNEVELLPPHTDDDPFSPLFPIDPLAMLAATSSILDALGLNVSLWYPAMYGNYSDPGVYAQALAEWTSVFAAMPRLDSIFIPGGDPGNHDPITLLGIAQLQKGVLTSMHAGATVWIGPQMWNASVMSVWYDAIATPSVQAWLDGVVYGPWTTQDTPAFRAATPLVYPIRLYPDICHSTTSQLPVWDWDPPLVITEHRESINPRPTQHATIAQLMLPYSVGFSGYSEGANDDFNKVLWSVVAWGPDVGQQPPPTPAAAGAAAAADYANTFFGGVYGPTLADVILGLEANWVGRVAASQSIPAVAAAMTQVLASTPSALWRNWRFQQLQYRTFYDAYTQRRLAVESAAEAVALAACSVAPASGSFAAITAAQSALANVTSTIAADATAQAWLLLMRRAAEALFHSVGMQLSVPLYLAECTERGANLDMVNYPLNNSPYLLGQLAAIAQMSSEGDRVAALRALAAWSTVPPGGFYDDCGVSGGAPHVLPGEGAATDPQYFRTTWQAFSTISSLCVGAPAVSARSGEASSARVSMPISQAVPSFPAIPLTWLTFAKAMYDAPLSLQYTGLQPNTSYSLTIVYANAAIGQGDGPIRLVANNVTVHDWLVTPVPMAPLTFGISANVVHLNGTTLTLSCYRQWDWTQSPSHSGCAVSEVWLLPEVHVQRTTPLHLRSADTKDL